MRFVAIRLFRPRLGLGACAAVLIALALATIANASSADVIRDCTDDEVLEGHYTQAELRNALAGLDADADEYTNCRDVIRQAQLQGASGVPATPQTEAGSNAQGPSASEANDARADRSTAAKIPGPFGGFGRVPVDPVASATTDERQAISSAHLAASRLAAARASLPTPLIGVLAIGGLALLVGLGIAVARRATKVR